MLAVIIIAIVVFAISYASLCLIGLAMHGITNDYKNEEKV
jgi:hypothetical protein